MYTHAFYGNDQCIHNFHHLMSSQSISSVVQSIIVCSVLYYCVQCSVVYYCVQCSSVGSGPGDPHDQGQSGHILSRSSESYPRNGISGSDSDQNHVTVLELSSAVHGSMWSHAHCFRMNLVQIYVEPHSFVSCQYFVTIYSQVCSHNFTNLHC